jgi:hypothetical protein
VDAVATVDFENPARDVVVEGVAVGDGYDCAFAIARC